MDLLWDGNYSKWHQFRKCGEIRKGSKKVYLRQCARKGKRKSIWNIMRGYIGNLFSTNQNPINRINKQCLIHGKPNMNFTWCHLIIGLVCHGYWCKYLDTDSFGDVSHEIRIRSIYQWHIDFIKWNSMYLLIITRIMSKNLMIKCNCEMTECSLLKEVSMRRGI